ncbi:MAG: T9SS type A sorting domain-containing protein [Mangrovibacterium sp.]
MRAFLLFTIFFFVFCVSNAQSFESNPDQQIAVKQEKVYPNPFSDYLVVEFTSQEYASATIELMDILGNPVQQWQKVEIVPGTQKIRLVLNNFHSGIYLLKVKVGSECFVTRLRKV